MLKRLLLLLVCVPLLVHARKAIETGTKKEQAEGPWVTGPLLTPSGHVIPFGHANYEPYLYWGTLTGKYDKHWHSHSLNPRYKTLLSQTILQFGILPGIELDILPQFTYNNHGGQHMWRVADMPFAVAFQILMDQEDTWWPAIKIRLGALAPLGKYDRSNPKKLGTDLAGIGDWAPSLAFVTIKTYHLGGHHYLSWRMQYQYTITVPVSLHGLSFWGGSPSLPGIKGTRGTVYPGCIFLAQQAFEYCITHNWVLALDIQYVHINRTRFSGRSPKILGVNTRPVAPSSELFSLAPALEYNFNANIGIIAGPWFSIAGRNSNQTFSFIDWVFAINIYH
jgi:hypothetical protein